MSQHAGEYGFWIILMSTELMTDIAIGERILVNKLSNTTAGLWLKSI